MLHLLTEFLFYGMIISNRIKEQKKRVHLFEYLMEIQNTAWHHHTLLKAVILEVGVEERLADEALLAVRTLIGPLTRVVALVDDQGGPLREGLAANLAGVRPLAGVNPLV